MESFNYAHDSGVFIQKCRQCLGTWLEAGQLERLAKYQESTPAVRALAETLGAEYGKATRRLRLRQALRSRRASGGVAVFYLLLAWYAGGGVFALAMARSLIFPVAFIWFADGLGNLTGIRFGGGLTRPVVTERTSGDTVAIVGWILLLLPILFLLWWAYSSA